MNPVKSFPCGRTEFPLTRRELLRRAGGGAAMVALAGMLADEAQADAPSQPRVAHFPAKAKAVIWLFMEGAPSAVDIFDPKPELTKNHGKRTDIKVFFGDPGPLMKSPFKFRRYGECGQWVCEKYTNVAKHVDELAFLKSCFSESDNHVPAIYQINSGLPRPGFPTAGAWINYGLGTVNQTYRAMWCSETPRAPRADRTIGALDSCPPPTREPFFAPKAAPSSIFSD